MILICITQEDYSVIPREYKINRILSYSDAQKHSIPLREKENEVYFNDVTILKYNGN